MAKSERFGFRLAPEEKKLLENLSLKYGESISVIVRRLIRIAASELRLSLDYEKGGLIEELDGAYKWFILPE
jgi:hypothetical protein